MPDTLKEAQAQPITLTLTPTKPVEEVVVEEVVEEPTLATPPNFEENLSPEEKEQVAQFAKSIDIKDSEMILYYGAAAQRKIGEFSENTLKSVKTKDLGETGQLMTNLIKELKSIEKPGDDKGFNLFKKAKDKTETLKSRYTSAEKNVDNIVNMLENHQVTLMKDITLLDEMYAMNLTNFKELSMYILAGKKRLEEARTVELEALKAKAMQSGLAEDSQAANDFAALCDRFEKKIHDLELTRTVALQMGPQIRLVQNNDILMSEKIQSTLVNTIPLWKSQMVLALGLEHSKQAMEAQRAVTDMTNQLLMKNAETLKQGSIGVAKESERGIIDIDTLTKTNQSLIDTLDEVMKIQDEGREKRRQAEGELNRIETELKKKLLDIR